MPLRVWSGPGHVIATGTVITFAGNPLHWHLETHEREIAVELWFTADPADPTTRVKTWWREDLGLLIEMFNVDDAAGRGSAEPVMLADLGDDVLFFHFRAFKHGRSDDRTVDYTFYRASKAAIRWTPVVPEPDRG